MSLGERATIEISVVGPGEEPVPAVLPLRVDILDPVGRVAEFSGYHAAKNGRLSVGIDLAPNDRAGLWKVRARELASGFEREETFRLRRLAAAS